MRPICSGTELTGKHSQKQRPVKNQQVVPVHLMDIVLDFCLQEETSPVLK
jgi:hypothetical protein